MELPNLKCSRCNKEYNSYNGLAKHATRTHKVTPADLQVEIYHNNTWPTCACGCGEKLEFGTSTPGKFAKYKGLHFQKTREGGFQTKEGLEKSAQTRRERFASGEIVQYNKGKKESELYSPEIIAKRLAANKSEARREKISKALKGKEKSPEQKERLAKMSSDYWSKQENRDTQRERRVQYMSTSQTKKQSKLEQLFQQMLVALGVDFTNQFSVQGYCYDFSITDKNILIEVDGDWWHCNPELNINPIYESQQHTVQHDKIKNKVAADNGYTLLRFWENDIKNNRKEVIAKLMSYI
jgi:very-short-patch-repair endonuclease